MQTYQINLTNIEKIQTLEIEANSREEAIEKAKEKFNEGNTYVYSNSLIVDKNQI